MNYQSLEPFIPSGPDFEKSSNFFQELGFEIEWNQHDLIGFRSGNCRFILQKFDNRSFAENLMLTVKVEDIQLFWKEVSNKKLSEKYGIPSISQPTQQPYGKEVNVIDMAGVCWHFIQP